MVVGRPGGGGPGGGDLVAPITSAREGPNMPREATAARAGAPDRSACPRHQLTVCASHLRRRLVRKSA